MSPPTAEPGFVLVGRVVKPHGLRGEVLVRVMTENPSRFDPGSELLLGSDPKSAHTVVVTASRAHLGRLLVAFDDALTAEEAEVFRGGLLFVPSSDLEELSEDAFWDHELVGMTVVRLGGDVLGTLEEVLERPAQDLWSIDTSSGPVLFPAARELVASIDRVKGIIVVDPPEGLFEPAD